MKPFIHAWFVLDAIITLAPPLTWWADGRTTPILWVPAALFYFLAVGLCTTASIIVACLHDRATGALDS